MSGVEHSGRGIAVITGAASGMGAAAARLMADGGQPLMITDVDAAGLELTAAHVRPRAVAETLPGDLADAGFLDALAAALADRPVAALIHCAGLSPTMAEPARILEVNLAATMRLIQMLEPRIEKGGAAVLFASSAGHLLGTALDEQIAQVTTPEAVSSLMAVSSSSGAAYAVSKRGVMMLARRAARSFGQRGARIVSVSPGIVDTPMGQAEMESQAIMKVMVEGSPLKRAARPEEVAAVAVFICSRAASFMTGTDVLIDGGAMSAMLPMGA